MNEEPNSSNTNTNTTREQPPPLEPVDVERVETERMDEAPRTKYAQGQFFYVPAKAPVISTWLCLFISWVFYAAPIPFTIFLAIPFNLAALILACICMARGKTGTGVLVLLLGTAGSFLVYMVGLALFVAGVAASPAIVR